MSHLARSSVIIALFFGIDKIFSFVRTLIINRQFGLSYNLDAFNAANNIPDMLSALISGGALGVALIPVISEYLERKGRPAAWDLFSRILNFAFIVTGVIALVAALISPWLVENFIARGFPAEYKTLTADLMRLDLVAIMIFSISGLVMAGLQANQHFILPALAPSLYNLGQIFGAAVLSPDGPTTIGPVTLPGFGMGIRGLVFGVIIGAALHLLIQVPGLIKYKFRWALRIDLRHPGVQRILLLMGPRVITMFFIQVFFIFRDYLASFMDPGSVSALNLGWFIMQVPETMLGTTIAIALLPTLSEIFAREDRQQFSQTVNGALRLIIAVTIPVAFLLIAGISPLAQAAFGFSPEETARVVLASRLYLFSLTGHALLEIGARSFYAQQDAKTPLMAAAINAVLYILLALLLTNLLGFAGIPLANILSFTFEALLLLWLLNRRFPGILKVANTLLRTAVVSVIISFCLYAAIYFSPISRLEVFPQAAASAGLMLVGLGIVIPFILPELRILLKLGLPVNPLSNKD